MVLFTHEQTSICSQKQLNDIVHEHTISCRQLFAGHVVGSRPMKRTKHLHRMIIRNYWIWISYGLTNYEDQDYRHKNCFYHPLVDVQSTLSSKTPLKD